MDPLPWRMLPMPARSRAMTVGPLQVLIVALVVLLLFGRKLGALGAALGRAVGGFRRALGDLAGRSAGQSGSTSEREGSPSGHGAPVDFAKAWRLVSGARRLRRFPFSLFR